MTEDNIKKAADILNSGKIIAFPTDTVYGLACDATNEDAVQKIYALKGRPFDKPLPIFTHCTKAMLKYVCVSPLEKKLIRLFWPGAMTLILDLREHHGLAPSVFRGQKTVAVRMPKKLSVLRLIHEFGGPLAVTSLNTSGETPVLKAADIPDSFRDQLDFILSDDEASSGTASTIIRCAWDDFTILRQGDLTREEILKRLSEG